MCPPQRQVQSRQRLSTTRQIASFKTPQHVLQASWPTRTRKPSACKHKVCKSKSASSPTPGMHSRVALTLTCGNWHIWEQCPYNVQVRECANVNCKNTYTVTGRHGATAATRGRHGATAATRAAQQRFFFVEHSTSSVSIHAHVYVYIYTYIYICKHIYKFICIYIY